MPIESNPADWDEIEYHMVQQPYSLKCAKCGEDLTVNDRKVDGDLDLFLLVDPCPSGCHA